MRDVRHLYTPILPKNNPTSIGFVMALTTLLFSVDETDVHLDVIRSPYHSMYWNLEASDHSHNTSLMNTQLSKSTTIIDHALTSYSLNSSSQAGT